jgi:hypothetical protein
VGLFQIDSLQEGDTNQDIKIEEVCGIMELKLTSNLVGFEVLTAVSTKMAVFWVVVPCSQRPDDGSSKDL